jgi:uncharacterized damage-inducible protein DinB
MMLIADLLSREFTQEMASTRKTLERVPAGQNQWDWKPHRKSGSLGWMAGHVANLPGFALVALTQPELDVANIQIPKIENQAGLLPVFDKISAETAAALSRTTDEQFAENWTLRRGAQVLLTRPRYEIVRAMCFNHIIHHRGQLTMYLRALDIPVPALYGPSADENPFAQKAEQNR